VEVDKGQLSQVLQNLVLNALQAMAGTGTVKLKAENLILSSQEIVGLPAPTKFVQISVEDNGVGITSENLPKIFDPYFTTKTNGNGLGLATCYSIIKRHDGYIMVDSTPGQGTIFRIYLPASEATVAVSPAKETAPVIGGGRILLMDDEPGVRKAIGSALSRLGYKVVLSSDGAEAVEHYRENMVAGEPFNAVLMDLTVRGGMGGMEATQKILALDPQAKVIIASGYSEDLVMSQYQDYGFSGMVSKPFKISELSSILVKIIQGEGE
jgi:CheY-like chemotaxis protein